MTAGVRPDSVATCKALRCENACAGVYEVYPAGRAHKSVHAQKSVTDKHKLIYIQTQNDSTAELDASRNALTCSFIIHD